MTAAVKQGLVPAGTHGPNQAPLTPNFFNSIFNDGMNPFDECFSGATTPGGISSLLNSTLRSQFLHNAAEKPKTFNTEALSSHQSKVESHAIVDQTLTPEPSPKSLAMAETTINPLIAISRSPSPFTFGNAFPDSPVSSITPITSPENVSSDSSIVKEPKKSKNDALNSSHRVRKSFSAPKPQKATHKRNLSLPQDWNSTIKVSPQVPDTQLAKQSLPRGMECQAKPPARQRARFDLPSHAPLVSRMDGIFVTESIPSCEIKIEPDTPGNTGMGLMNATGMLGNRKRKSSTSDSEDDEDNSGLNDEEKRARFLERNRIAASKCRKKKKLMNQRLEEKSRLLVQQNRFLSATLAKLRGDVLRLKQLVLLHHDCKHAPIERYLHQEAGRYLGGNDNEEHLRKHESKEAKVEHLTGNREDGVSAKPEMLKAPTWLDEFHSFQEVESEALKRSNHILEFDDEEFQKLLLGDQLDFDQEMESP